MSLTKQDLKQIELLLDKKLDQRFTSFETGFEAKMDQKFANQSKELKAFAEEQTDALARIIATTISIPMQHNFRIIGEKLI